MIPESHKKYLNASIQGYFQTILSSNSYLFVFEVILGKGSLISKGTLTLVTFQKKGAKSRHWAESLNFPPFAVNNWFKFSAQDSDLEYLLWSSKNFPVFSDLKPPLAKTNFFL